MHDIITTYARLSNAPRQRIQMSDSDIAASFERLGYKVDINQLAFTMERVEDFFQARKYYWSRVGTVKIYDPPGILLVENAQPLNNQPTRDIVVISLGCARAIMGVITPRLDLEFPRYAPDML